MKAYSLNLIHLSFTTNKPILGIDKTINNFFFKIKKNYFKQTNSQRVG